jgi:hypothetical protein
MVDVCTAAMLGVKNYECVVASIAIVFLSDLMKSCYSGIIRATDRHMDTNLHDDTISLFRYNTIQIGCRGSDIKIW